MCVCVCVCVCLSAGTVECGLRGGGGRGGRERGEEGERAVHVYIPSDGMFNPRQCVCACEGLIS